MIITRQFDQVHIAQSFTYNGIEYIKTKLHYIGNKGPYNAAVIDTEYRRYFEDTIEVIPI